jgi:LPS-assembly protein
MRTKPGPSRYALLPLLSLLFAPVTFAGSGKCADPTDPACRPQSGWTLCRVPLASPVTRPTAEERLRSELLIDAGRAEYFAGTRAELGDGFQMTRLDQVLQADRGSYDSASGTFHAVGDVYYREAGVALTGDELELAIDSGAGQVEAARYALVEQHARGSADRATWNGAGHAALERATYTTCDPGDGSWLLSASRIDLDFDEGLGEAEQAVLRLKGVPVFYTPWIQFPIDDRRRSGLLMPSFGNSSTSGIELAVPWYWNIAPNRDVTITPRLLSKRGLQLATEYRYLYQATDNPGSRQQGEVDFEILPGDDVYGDDRLGLRVVHDGQLPVGWQVGVDAGFVSDKDYLRDLGNSLAVSNTNYVDRRGYVSVTRSDWAFLGQVNYLQPLVEFQPYQALPQLLFDYTPYVEGPVRYGLDSELVHYDRSTLAGGFIPVTGTRLDLKPWLSAPIDRSWGYLDPRLAVRYTGYALDDQFAVSDSRPGRTLPQATLDGGLFFDRSAFGGRFRQTLEPRFFYLYTPYEDQDGLIRNSNGQSVVFDSTLPLFEWSSLFRDNRFSGADRVGDANQLSLAVSSRMIDDDSGVEHARFDLGQILYFRDREVTLPGQPVATESSSPIIGRVRASLDHNVGISGSLTWNPHTEHTDLGTLAVSYQPGQARLLHLAYRNNGDNIEQTDIGVSWPLGAQWQGVGRWVYSLRDKTSLETFAGFEYKSCCWAARLVLREFVPDTLLPDDKNTAVMFQLELSGLARIGDDITGFLSGTLPGYTEPRR